MIFSISSDTGPSAVIHAGVSVRRELTTTLVTEPPNASFIAPNKSSFSLVTSSASFFSSSDARSMSPPATFLSYLAPSPFSSAP